MKKYRNIICLILGIITTFSLLFQVTAKGLKFYRSNTMMITYVVLAILLFVFYKKYFAKFKRRVTYNIIAIISSGSSIHHRIFCLN